MTQTEKGQFVQFPVQLIYGQAELTRDDKWVLLAIMGECWAEGTYRISYREISALADIPISLLSTFTDKKTGKYHEGIINRITRVTGYLIMETGKEINAATGKLKGNAQTYITINYARIWQDNRNYCEARKSRQVVSNKDYQPVSHTNKVVSYTNNPDSNTNNLVSNVNKPVSDLPLESPTYITKTIEDITDKNIDVNASALTPTPSQENENAYPQENTSSQHQQASTVDNSQQANKDILIATTTPQGSVSVDMPIRNTDSLFSDVPSAPDTPQQNGHRKPRTPKVDPDLQKRIEAVLVALDECAREVMGDADFAYRRRKVATEEVTSLLKERRVTREDLHAVYLKMWNTPPDPRTGFDWKKNMTVKAFCNNFDRMLIEIKGNAKQNGTGNTTPKQETTSVLGVSGQRHYEFEPLPFRKAR